MISLFEKKTLTVFFYLILLFFTTTFLQVQAQETHLINYSSEYFAQDDGSCIVSITAKITHLRSDVAVRELSYKFPKNFTIDEIRAKDNLGQVSITREEMDNSFRLKLFLNNPPVGKNTENEVILSFKQNNLIKQKGHILEVILPVIRDEKNSKNKVVFHLPQNSEKILSLSKPKPNLIRDKTIYWENISEKTIYATFGDFQVYHVVLSYHLQNQNLFPLIKEVAFPPETLFQTVYIKNIEPKPNKVYLDSDDNFLAQYQLNPKEKKIIFFDGYIKTRVQPQKELMSYFKGKFEQNKNFYLSSQPFWDVNQSVIENQIISSLKRPDEIYQFLVNFFQYDFNKLKNNPDRLGAEKALLNPRNVVCLEFTDTFIALARERGIPAREINGYGYSEEQDFRPISLSSDILHSWPEYFDQSRGIWVPVDPTWENTSGIDYFTSLDFNHITFVIHGKNSTYPLSAGLYKIEKTKDVSVEIIDDLPLSREEIKITDEIPSHLVLTKGYRSKLVITNTGNVYLKDKRLSLSSNQIMFKQNNFTIDLLPPFGQKAFLIDFQPISANQKAKINFNLDQKRIKTKEIKITNNSLLRKIFFFLDF